jgi:hypothetical protein
MLSHQLTISYNDDDGWVDFHKKSPYGNVDTFGFELPNGFTIACVYQAVLATGWVERRGEGYVAERSVRCTDLCRTVEEMFLYFDGPEEPSGRLLQIREAVGEYFVVQDADLDIPLWAYAWLDLIVRDDMADEARCADDVWKNRELVINSESHCHRRVKELVARYSQAAAEPSTGTGRMAPSSRERRRTDLHEPKAETG